MFSPDRRVWHPCRPALFLAICLVFLPDTAPAQSGADSGFVVVETLEPPRGARSTEYLDTARRKAARTNVEYVSDLDGDLVSGRSVRRGFETRSRGNPVSFNGFGALFALLVTLGLLFLWMKFGGSGTLLEREPKADRATNQAPQTWKITDEELDLDARSLLSKIANMTDRTDALVYLLRYSLLAGARATQVRLARSDTERSALVRLPRTWTHRDALHSLLVDTELAHYGGRAVKQEEFERAMEIGKTILTSVRHV